MSTSERKVTTIFYLVVKQANQINIRFQRNYITDYWLKLQKPNHIKKVKNKLALSQKYTIFKIYQPARIYQ